MKKQIEEFPNYSIDEKGQIFNNTTGKQLKRRKNIEGYYVVNLTNEKGSFHRRCGRLVGLTFLKDSYKEGLVIDHIDHDRSNDHVSNLEWVTTLENNLRSIKINPHKHIRDSNYDEAFIRSVCELIQDGVRNKDICEKTGITRDALSKVRCGLSWTWVSKDYKLTPSRKGISEDTASWVCYEILKGLKNKEILSKSTNPKLSIDIIKKIRNKKSWVNVSKHILE